MSLASVVGKVIVRVSRLLMPSRSLRLPLCPRRNVDTINATTAKQMIVPLTPARAFNTLDLDDGDELEGM